MDFVNCYEDATRADAYSKLEFARTYYLAYRDLPAIISEHVTGRDAVDFGCGTGRSTRFLQKLGFDTIGVDIAEDMLRKARESDPGGDYRLVGNGDLRQLTSQSYDLVLSAFTFDNIPTMEGTRIFKELRRLLHRDGKIVSIVSSPEMYTHEWASFSTKDFPENRNAQNGDKVRIITTDFDDRRPAVDILWTDESYREVYRNAGLEVVATYSPLAEGNEPYEWVNETKISPWVIYVLKKAPEVLD